MNVLAYSLAELWGDWLWPVFQLVIGLGLVVFVHELGHFLVAKWVSIKVEKFAIGFGPTIFSFTRGETEYCIKAIPLGGYIKMLGQEDFKPLEEGGKPDPRSFMAKSVGARFAVIAAGVVMNVIFAALLFIVVCTISISFPAPIVGGVSPKLPASEAKIVWENPPEGFPAESVGLEPGDRILSIDGRYAESFELIRVKSILADPDEIFDIRLERKRGGNTLRGTAKVAVAYTPSEYGKMLKFGIAPPQSTTFARVKDLKIAGPVLPGDTLVKIADFTVAHAWDIAPIAKKLDGSPVGITVLRRDEDAPPREVSLTIHPAVGGGKLGDVLYEEGTRYYGREIRRDDKNVFFRLEDGTEKKFATRNVSVGQDELLDVLGMIPRLEIAAVFIGSPAETAGLEPGDVITDYGERGAPTVRGMLDINKEFAAREVRIEVLRGTERLQKTIVPKKRSGGVLVGIAQSIDLQSTVVAGVRKGSIAEKAGVRKGDVIEQVVVSDADGANSETASVTGWVDVLNVLKKSQGKLVSLKIRGQVSPRKIGILGKDVFDAKDYKVYPFAKTLGFGQLEVTIVKRNPLAAMAWGAQKACDFIVMTYGTLRGILNRNISTKAVSGPVGIGGIAIQAGRQSISKLIYLMAIISVSLAVINFLPIPVVDGGHAVFLLIEKIRGKPVPVKIMNITQVIGLLALLFVFVAVTWQDILRLLGGLW